MGMKLQRYSNSLFKFGHQLIAHIGSEQPSHIFNTDRICARIFNLASLVHPQVNGVHRAYCVRNSTLSVLAHLLNGTQSGFKVAHVIHGVKHAEHINAIDRRTFDKLLYHVVGIVPVTQNILAAEQHLLWRIGHCLFNFPNTVPWILSQVANTGVKCGTTPGFH